GCSSRLANDANRTPHGPEAFGQDLNLSRFSPAFGSFEADEKSFHSVLTGLRGLEVSRSTMKSDRFDPVSRDEADSSDKGLPTTRFGPKASRIVRSRRARIREVGLTRIAVMNAGWRLISSVD